MAKKPINTIDPSELEMTPCTWRGDHEPHIWSWSQEVQRSEDIDFNRIEFRFKSDNRLCPGITRPRTDEEKWQASKRAMITLTWVIGAGLGSIYGMIGVVNLIW